MLVAVHFMFFDYLLNLTRYNAIELVLRSRHPGTVIRWYHVLLYNNGEGFDRIWSRVPFYAQPLLRAAILYTAYYVYFHLDQI